MRFLIFSILVGFTIARHLNENNLVGTYDKYGCIPSAGYAWCNSTSECLHWTVNCDI